METDVDPPLVVVGEKMTGKMGVVIVIDLTIDPVDEDDLPIAEINETEIPEMIPLHLPPAKTPPVRIIRLNYTFLITSFR